MNNQPREVLNREVMRNLIGDDMVLIRKFEVEFLQQAKLSVAKIVQLYGREQFSEIKEEAHFLKTSAKAVGAEQVADLLETLEGNALEKAKEKCKQGIVLISRSLKQVYGAVKYES